MSADRWRAAYEASTLVGRNDDTPYGYGRAAQMGCSVEFSTGEPLNVFQRGVWLGARGLLGCDLVHARTQLDRMMQADVVWTHTESHALAVAAVLGKRANRPKIIGQAVWLFDLWPRLSPVHKYWYRHLIDHIDVITTLSPLNADMARDLFPHARVEFVPFGIPAENPVAPVERSGKPVRVLSVGNDRHRDWPTLLSAVARLPDVELEIFSRTAARYVKDASANIVVKVAETNLELNAAYGRASVVVVPLHANLHASGITVVEEALLAGVPVIASDAGGLRGYFDSDEIFYVPVGSAKDLAEAIDHVARHSDLACAMVKKAQARIASTLNVERYIGRHVAISREIAKHPG